ncbi:MAG: alpha/beta fold hydrolase [Gemmatales bacterium]|nr:alpha/beta fold hydrolase [Gemmatales bacterium]MDW7995177.1 alpha/beta fold hydrolase [Gemmatales bacterium]
MFEKVKQWAYGARYLLARRGEKTFVELPGRRVQLWHGGEGPAFVYLHSGLGETVWLPFHNTWAKDFHVYVPAHPGFAESTGIEMIDSMDDLALHYAELLDHLGLTTVCLGGVSLGGWLAAEFAVRWPERVQRLWIADAPGLWSDEHPYADLFRYAQDPARLRQLLFHEPQGAMATMIIRDLKQMNEETFLAAYRALRTLARLTWERPYSPKLAHRLYRIRCPVLIIWGEDDRLIPPAYAHLYAQHIAQARVEILPRCGHLPMFEREATFVELIRDFCRS